MRNAPALALALILPTVAFAAQETKLINGFEDDAELSKWEFKKSSVELSDQYVTQGKKSIKINSDEYMVSFKLPKDWSGYDSMELDIFVDGADNIGVSLLVADDAFQKKPDYWNRHNGGFNLKPGKNTASIPVNGLYRGEAGSRGNDLKTNIDPATIWRFDMGFKGKANAIYVDNMRLVKETRPAGIMAFDFGPESQVLFPGFTGISWNTLHGQNGNKAGLKRAGSSKSLARDDTFPTRLYQDFVEMANETNANEFIVDAPDGKYQAWMMYDDCGYWGGENCKHKRRSVENNGREVFVDDRGEDGPRDYLYRFEKIEPKPGDSLWELYMKDLFKPRRFEVAAVGGKISLVFKSDAPWSSKVAALILYPDAQKAEAEKWVAEIESRNRQEFELRAAFVGPKPKQLDLGAPVAGAYHLGFPGLEETITLVDAPGKPDGKLSRAAAQGQRISYTFAIRPVKDLGDASCALIDAAAWQAAGIDAKQVDFRYVHHSTKRGFNDIAYEITPESLRKVAGSGLKLGKDFTRQFWVTVDVPRDAKPGKHAAKVQLQAGGQNIVVPIEIEVLDFTLDEPDYAMGFYGVHGDPTTEKGRAVLRDMFSVLKKNGMNSFTGGPNIRFNGFDDAGKPKLDFAACDEFFKLVKEAGFTKELQAYGGPAMVQGLHDGYVIGETGRNWEKTTGKPFKELLKIVWGAVKEHADAAGWPAIAYGFTDEPRVLEQAQAQVELMKAYREAVPFVKIGGSYSVHWGDKPLDKAIQEIFKTLVWSGLNSHHQIDVDKAKEFGRELYIYNQGIDRYSFGAYQYAEMRKGVRARMQWHLLALHGYQFFDLDGREPDTAMINHGKDEIIPTIHLHRCREGADDFRYAVTLENLAAKKKDTAEGKAAQAFLDEVSARIGVGQRKHPDGFMTDETFRATCIEHIRKLK